MLRSLVLALTMVAIGAAPARQVAPAATWTADNGNGTYTNPLFFDEFSDPDMIRVGDDFYLTGTTMHAMPGLPVLHSRDLVNWNFVGYAMDKLDLGPAYRLEGGQNIYGRGIWAPSFRYHAGTFYIFSNVNGATTQVFTARSPAGPWTRTPMKRSFHDLSVLFDDDGATYVIWGYQEIHLARLDPSLTDIVAGSERIIIPKGAAMGEGSHFYKIDGQYFVTSAEWSGPFRMPAARARSPYGPYQVNRAISEGEDFGEEQGYRLSGKGPFTITPPDPHARGGLSMHQGGIIQTPKGDWWGWSMFEGNAVGRLTALSPVTWKDGWPWFGLPGNLGRTPRTWVKPDLPGADLPYAPYRRNDDFDGPRLQPIWQWNHVPVESAWSLRERPGALRLHTLPAPDLLQARNTLTQRAIGPQSTPTAELDASGLEKGGVAGLALLNRPYAWIGIERSSAGLTLVTQAEQGGRSAAIPLRSGHVWLRASCDYTVNQARFSYSVDGQRFTPIGPTLELPYQLLTFQGVRYGLFAFHSGAQAGEGQADFLSFRVTEARPESRPAIPYARRIRLVPMGKAGQSDLLDGPVTVLDRSLGRVALVRDGRALTVDAAGATSWQVPQPGTTQVFQWMEALSGGATLMSLRTNRYLHLASDGRPRADSVGPTADNADGSRFAVAEEKGPRR